MPARRAKEWELPRQKSAESGQIAQGKAGRMKFNYELGIANYEWSILHASTGESAGWVLSRGI
jgi:hypothetical protein